MTSDYIVKLGPHSSKLTRKFCWVSNEEHGGIVPNLQRVES